MRYLGTRYNLVHYNKHTQVHIYINVKLIKLKNLLRKGKKHGESRQKNPQNHHLK